MTQPQAWPSIFIPIGTCLDAVLDVFDLTYAEFRKWPRRKTPTLARGAVIIIARACSPASYTEIGRALGIQSGSVTHCQKRSVELQKKDPRYAELIQRALTRALELMTERAGKGPGVVKAKLRSVS